VSSRHRAAWYTGGLLFLLSTGLSAAEPGLAGSPPETARSSLWFKGGYDSDEARDYGIDLDLALGRHDAVLLGAGRSIIPQEGDDFNADSFALGYSTRRLDPLAFTLGYDSWGDRDELTTKRSRLGMDWTAGAWTFGFAPERRRITLFTRPIPERREVKVKSKGWELSLAYLAGEHWRFRLAGARYAYTKNMALLNTSLVQRILSSKTLTLSAGMLEQSVSGEIGYEWDRKRLAVVQTRSVSAIDQSRTDSTALVLGLDLTNKVTVELEGGRSDPEIDADTNYGRVTVGYHW
jgi:hypothetical protein